MGHDELGQHAPLGARRSRRVGRHLLAAALGLAVAAPVAAAQPSTDPTVFASTADVRSRADAMTRAMTPGQGFAWQKLAEADGWTAGLEVWKKPGKPAVHPDQAEYTIVIAGAGTMISGGKLVDPQVTQPELTEGSRIEGGTERPLAPGDVILIPAGTPHWFGVTGDRLVLLGIKLPRR